MLSHFLSNKLSWKHMFRSVFSALIGIQKADYAHQDFKLGNLYVYAALGIAVVIVFIFAIMAVVNWVL